MLSARRVNYRLATFEGGEDSVGVTFEDALRIALQGPLGEDYDKRAFAVGTDRPDKAMINNSELSPPGVFVEIYHLDGRRELPFVQRKKEPAKTASVLSRTVPDDEDSMGSAAYLMVMGNHIAAIEPFALRVGSIQGYLNAFLQAAGQLEASQHWKLAPKVQTSGNPALLKRGVTKFEIRPIARLVGDAPSNSPMAAGARRPSKTAETRIAKGGKVIELLEVLGARVADLGELRASMSNDLGLEAKVEFTVRKNNQKTAATLETADISQAIASLEEDNSVQVVSPDGRTRGKLTTLSDQVEIAEEGGLLPLQRVAAALTSTLLKWSGKGIIDLSGHIP